MPRRQSRPTGDTRINRMRRLSALSTSNISSPIAIDSSDIKELGGDNYTVKATTPIADFNERFGTRFSDAEFDTIGGLLMKHFGHLPKRDETIAMGGLMFEVLNADSRRIRLMRVSPVGRDH